MHSNDSLFQQQFDRECLALQINFQGGIKEYPSLNPLCLLCGCWANCSLKLSSMNFHSCTLFREVIRLLIFWLILSFIVYISLSGRTSKMQIAALYLLVLYICLFVFVI